MSQSAHIPVFGDSINRSNLIMIESKTVFQFSKDAFDFPSEAIPLDNIFWFKFKVISDIDMDFFRIFAIPLTYSYNGEIITFKTMNFGFEAVNEERSIFTFGIGRVTFLLNLVQGMTLTRSSALVHLPW